jgi:hypothetical protein
MSETFTVQKRTAWVRRCVERKIDFDNLEQFGHISKATASDLFLSYVSKRRATGLARNWESMHSTESGGAAFSAAKTSELLWAISIK